MNVSLESGLNEQGANTENKKKWKKKYKMVEGIQSKLDQKSDAELRKRKENSLIDVKGSEAALKIDSNLETRENAYLESGLKKELALSEKKRRTRKKKNSKMAKCGQNEKLDQNFDVELGKGKHNSLIDVKQIELVLKERANSLIKETLLDRDSNGESLENIGLDRLKLSQLSEQLGDQGMRRKRQWKKKAKMAKAEQYEKLDANPVFLYEQQGGPCMESKMIDDFESKLKEEANSNVLAQENASLESGLQVSQPNELIDQLERKRRKKREKRKKRKESRERLRTVESNNVSSKRYDGDNNEVEKENMWPKTQRTNKKDFRTEDNMSILQNIESNLKKNSLITGEQIDIDSSQTARVDRPDATLFRGHDFSNNISGKDVIRRRERKRTKKPKESLCKYTDQKVVEIQTRMEELIPSPSNLLSTKDDIAPSAIYEDNNLSRTLQSSLLQQMCITHPKKKLLVLDLNGILVDVVEKPGGLKPDTIVSKKAVFRRPFCYDFLDFCFEKFNVGIWSSRIDKNVNILVDFLMRKWRDKILFCFHRAQCTITKFKTLEDKRKPLVLKELRKVWEYHLLKGEYDESNTLLLDDSPYKALRNPANTAIFPYPYRYNDYQDSSLAPCGDIRRFLEGLAASKNVQKYVEQNPFGQPAITEADPHWKFYCRIIDG